MSLNTTLDPITRGKWAEAVSLVSTPATWIIHRDDMMCVETGEVLQTYHLQGILRRSVAGGYVCGTRLYQEVGPLTEILQDLAGWQMRTSIIPQVKRGLVGPNGKPAMRGNMLIDYLTFKTLHTHSKIREHRIRWYMFNLEAFLSTPPDTMQDKAEAVAAILGMLQRRGVKFRPSRGSAAGAMLKASPLWLPTLTDTKGVPFKRRYPAPAFVNDQAREVLPGNHYSVIQGRLGNPLAMNHCYLIDQNSAHHTIASTVPLPHPEHIHARGHFHEKDIEARKRWVTPDSDIGQKLADSHIGLVCALIQIGHLSSPNRHLYPKWAQQPGTHVRWLWTPELRLFQADHRTHIVHYICAMTATREDLALREYAQWALEELKLPGKEYKKSTLLAVYGILAMNTHTRHKAMYAWAGTQRVNGGSPMYLPLIGDVTVRKIGIPEGTQPRTLNVAARGVIEAETRTRSIEYARELTAQGIEVAQIYVDGLLLHTHKLPFLKEGWRVSHSLSDVTIPQVNGFRSNELTKLPGHPRERALTRERARAPFSGMGKSR